EKAALDAGKKTRSEVAAAAMKLADKAEIDATRLLLMKGAFILYVQDGNLEKAVETLNSLKAAIPDIPPQSVTNIIETALSGVSKENRGELRKLLNEAKKVGVESDALKAGTLGRPKVVEGQKSYGGYTWSYRVKNDEATLMAEKDGKPVCAVSPTPTGDVTIPPTLNYIKVTKIGQSAFKYCKELTSVTIPEGVTYLDTWAFDSCGGLKSVTLPSSLKEIGYAAFGKCMALKSVTIPNGVKSIRADAFNGCGLKSVVLPGSVTGIGDRAFCGCRELESVAIPAGVARMGKGVFAECNALKIINVDSGNPAYTVVDGVLYTKDCSELVMWPNPRNAVVIPKGVTSIRGWALAGGKEMTSVTIPEGVTNIGDVAFLDCVGLKSVTIPSSVKKIEEHAFGRCGELAEVTMLGERPEAANEIFKKCGKLKAIHVPANAKSWAGMKDWFGIPLVFDAEDAGRQTQTESAEPRSSLLNRRRLVRDRIREEEVRRREAELRAQEEQRQRRSELEEQRRQLEQIQEELRKAREEREKAEQAAAQQR
ncbi:MAG: leucine-rich repeat protein, partial [Kiritimatiellae bacterium]|nr:leucine-rich repeat protein [Kiritimatiellia bacterium]